VKPAPFRYRRPASLDEALGLLAGTPGAKVLAGGQSLVPLLNMRLAAPETLVDLGAVPGLDTITVSGEGVRVGAMVRHADLLADAAVAASQPLVPLALSHVAHATIRNRGTTVGSLVHADAAAEMPAVLCLLGGSVEAASVRGTRTIPADELYAGPLESTLAADEVATSAFFPALGPGEGVAFAEIARRHGDYAMVGVAAHVSAAAVRLGYLSVSDTPVVVDVTGRLEEAAEVALEQLDPVGDIHATAAYRAHLVRVLTGRVLAAAKEMADAAGA
jgi:2-furoyl-CoA dehydrogenase FAD binding subunit